MNRINCGFISSSDEGTTITNVLQATNKRDNIISDSDSDIRRGAQYNRARLNELCDGDDSSESGIPALRRNAKKISSKRNSRSTRIASDSSDDDDEQMNLKTATSRMSGNKTGSSTTLASGNNLQQQYHQDNQDSSSVDIKIKAEIKSEDEEDRLLSTDKKSEVHSSFSSAIKSEQRQTIKTEMTTTKMLLSPIKVEPKNEIKEQQSGDCCYNNTQNEISESENNNCFSGSGVIGNKDSTTFDSSLFSPEAARKKHKKSKKRQKSSPSLLLSAPNDASGEILSSAVSAAVKFEENIHHNDKSSLSTTSLEHVFDELKRESMLAAAVASATISTNSCNSTAGVGSNHSISEKKKHKDRKDKKREKSRDDDKSLLTKEERHKLKKSKKSKNNDINRYPTTTTAVTTSTVKRSGEKMEDIFGPISDEESQLSAADSIQRDGSTTASHLFEISSSCHSHTQQPVVSAAINPYKQEPLTPKSHTVEENEENKQRSSSHLERERHRKDKREKKRKERERNREQHAASTTAFQHQQKVEDDNSVDLDEAGRALEAQLMDDSDNKLNEETTPSTATTHKSDMMADVFRFSDGDENSMEVVTTPQEKKESSQELVHRSKEKKKKKKRSKEERHHQRREHHHHSSSHNNSNSLLSPPPPTLSSSKLSIEIAASDNVDDVVVKDAICKPSPSLPCLLDDDAASSPPPSITLLKQQQPTAELNKTASSPVIREKNLKSPIPKTPSTTTTPKPVECKKKPDKFIPGFDVELDEKISESAVKSISAEFTSPVIDPVPEDPKIPIESPPDLSKNIDKMEEKSRVVISQEETEDAVAALLGESFGTSSAPDYSFVDDSLDVVQPEEEENLETVIEPPVIPEEEGEEIRKAVQSLSNDDIDIKPDTPQSERDLQIDTDTEEPEEDTNSQTHFDNPPKTPDIDLSQIKQSSTTTKVITTPANVEETTSEEKSSGDSVVKMKVEIPQSSIESIFDIESKKIEENEMKEDVKKGEEERKFELSKIEAPVTTAAITSTTLPTPISFATQIPISSQIVTSTVATTQPTNTIRSQPQTMYSNCSTSLQQKTPQHQSIAVAQAHTIQTSPPAQQQQQKIPNTSRTQTQYVMQPPTISIPDQQQHFVYSPINVMVSPRQTSGGERMPSPRLPPQLSSSQSQQQSTGTPQPGGGGGGGQFVSVRVPSPHSPTVHRGQQAIRHQSQLSPVIQQHVVIQQRQQQVLSPSNTVGPNTQQQTAGVISSSTGSTNIILNRMPVTSVLAPISKPIQPTNIILPQPSTAQASNISKAEDTKEIKLLSSGQTITYQTARVSTPTSVTPTSSVNTSPHHQATTIQIAGQKLIHQPQGVQPSPMKSVIETHTANGQTTHIQHIIPVSMQQQQKSQHQTIVLQQQQQQQPKQQHLQQQPGQRLSQPIQSTMQKMPPHHQQHMMQQHQFIQQQQQQQQQHQRQHQMQLQQQMHQQKHMQQQQQAHHAQMMHLIQQQKQQQQQQQQHLPPQQHRIVQQHVLQMHQYQQQQQSSQVAQKESPHKTMVGSSGSIIQQALPIKDVQTSAGHSPRIQQNVVIMRQQTGGVIPQQNLQKISQQSAQIHHQQQQQQQQIQMPQQQHIQQQHIQMQQHQSPHIQQYSPQLQQSQRQYTQLQQQVQQQQQHSQNQNQQQQHGMLQQISQQHVQVQQLPTQQQQRQLHTQKPQQAQQQQQQQQPMQLQQVTKPLAGNTQTIVQPLTLKIQPPRPGDGSSPQMKALKVQIVAQPSQVQQPQPQSQVMQPTAPIQLSTEQAPHKTQQQQQSYQLQPQSPHLIQTQQPPVLQQERLERSPSVEQIPAKRAPVLTEVELKLEEEENETKSKADESLANEIENINTTEDKQEPVSDQKKQLEDETTEISESFENSNKIKENNSSNKNVVLEKCEDTKLLQCPPEKEFVEKETESSLSSPSPSPSCASKDDVKPLVQESQPQEIQNDNTVPSEEKFSSSSLTEENVTKLSPPQDDELEQDSKEDSDYWSAKELNIDSVIKKVDALCSNDEVDESQINSEKDNEKEIKGEEISPQTDEESFEKEASTPRKLSESEQSEQAKSESGGQLECPLECEKSEKSEDTHDEEEQEDNQVDTTDAVKATRGSAKRGRPSKNAAGKKTIEKTSSLPAVSGTASATEGGVQTRRGGGVKNTQGGTRNRRGRPTTKAPASGPVLTAGEKKARSQISTDQDVYEFHEDSGEETTTNSSTTSTTATTAKTASDRPRLILTIKSPGQASTTAVVSTTKTSNEKPTTTTNASPSSTPPPSSVQQVIATEVPVQKNEKDKETKEEFSAPAANTRKSRRLQEKDGGGLRNTVDDVIEDVVRNSLNSPKSGGGQTPPRRSTRNSQNTGLGRTPTPQTVAEKTPQSLPEVRKSPRANRRTKDRKSSDASVDSSDEKSTKMEEKPKPPVPSPQQDEQQESISKTTEEIVDSEPPNKERQPTPEKINDPELPVVVVEKSTPERTVEKIIPPTNESTSEPMALIDPVTGVLTVVRQSKEGQYVPISGNGTGPGTGVTTAQLHTVVTKVENTVTHIKVPTPPIDNVKSETKTIIEEEPKLAEVKPSTPIVSQESEMSRVSTPVTTVVATSPIISHKPTSVVVTSSQVTPPPPSSTPTSVVTQSHVAVSVRTPPPQQLQSQLQPQPQPLPLPQPQPQLQSQSQPQTQSQPSSQPQPQSQSVSQPTIRTHPLKAHMLNAAQKDNKSVVVTQSQGAVKTNTNVITHQTAPVVVNPNVIKQPSTIVQTNIVSRHLQQSGTGPGAGNSPQILVPAAQQPVQPQHSNLVVHIPPSNSPHAATPPLSTAHSPRIQQSMLVKQQQQHTSAPQQSQQPCATSSQPVVHVVTKSGNQQQQQHIPIQQTQHQSMVIQSQKIPQGQNPYNAVTIQTAVTIQAAGGKHQTIQVPLPHIQSQQQHAHAHAVQKQQPSSGVSVVHPIVKQGSTPPIQAHLNPQHHLSHQQTVSHLSTVKQQAQSPQIQISANVPAGSQHIIAHAHHQSSHGHQATGASLLQAKPAHQQQVIPPSPKGVIGLHQSPQIMTGAVASPPLKQSSHMSSQQPIVTGASSLRASVPPISPQGQATSRAHILQPGLPVPAFEANLGEGTFSTSAAVRGIPRDHFIMYQQYLRAQEALGARIPYIPRSPLLPGSTDQKDMSDIDESIAASPPLELRRPGSGPRTIPVPHSLQSPQDRATDSPQVAQVYVHGTRIPHPHYPEVGARYFDNIRQVPNAEPPPAHRPAAHSVIAPPSASNYGPSQAAVVAAAAATGGPPAATLTQHMHSKAIEREQREREHRERERERERERDKERQSLPGHTSMPSHGSLVPAMPTPTGRNIQVATPPHASQVPPQADSLLMLLQRYPVMWQGLLALKTDQAAVQMHFVFGNPHVARGSLPCNSDGSTPPLRIAQRMRLEQTQLEGVAKKMQYENEHCMLLALPCGRDHMDVLQQSRNLQTGFITYLQQKMAAGIVNIPVPGSEQAAYVVHIFPSCDFANENLERAAPDLKHRVAEIAHLLIVIATV